MSRRLLELRGRRVMMFIIGRAWDRLSRGAADQALRDSVV